MLRSGTCNDTVPYRKRHRIFSFSDFYFIFVALLKRNSSSVIDRETDADKMSRAHFPVKPLRSTSFAGWDWGNPLRWAFCIVETVL